MPTVRARRLPALPPPVPLAFASLARTATKPHFSNSLVGATRRRAIACAALAAAPTPVRPSPPRSAAPWPPRMGHAAR